MAGGAAGSESTIQGELWRSLRFFTVYRLVIALLLASAVRYADVLEIGAQNRELYARASITYVVLAAGFLMLVMRARTRFTGHLSLQIVVDIVLLTVMMSASGGQKSGLAALILIAVAGAGLVGQGRLTLFFAALASLAILLEQGLQTLRMAADPGEFLRTGLVCIGFFATAIMARLLARRALANELLAQARGLELGKQQAVNERIISEMADGVLVLDANGTVQQSNAMASRMLDVRIGSSNLRQWSPELATRLRSIDANSRVGEDRVTLPGGTGLRLRLQRLSDSGDDSAIVYIEDMERVRQQAQQLKLAALGRLTANIAHEIRNPLASIVHAAELLAEDEHEPQRRRLTSIITSNADRLNQLISEVLELGRRDRASREALDWEQFVRMLIEELALHDPGATSRIRLEGADVRVWFDRGHLHRVLANLLLNALRHASPAPGGIQLRVGMPFLGRVAIDVIDDGPGITPAIRDQVFEPFVTGHGAGTGLGLYIARELCEANGAGLVLQADDTEAHGAHFRMTLEIVEQ